MPPNQGKIQNILVPNATGMMSRSIADLEIHTEGIKVGEKTLTDWMAEMEAKVDAILEAIALNHQKGPDGKCVPDCWSCRVMETIEGIRVSNRLRGK